MCGDRFLVDSMNGKLAKWLRILGCDSIYVDPGKDDLDILKSPSGRMLVTRDRELVRRALNSGITAIYVPQNLEDALAELSLIKDVRLRIDPKSTRCPFCNEKLELVGRSYLSEGLDRGILRSHRRFLLCPSCGKVFWFGTHYWGMLRTLARAKKKKSRE